MFLALFSIPVSCRWFRAFAIVSLSYIKCPTAPRASPDFPQTVSYSCCTPASTPRSAGDSDHTLRLHQHHSTCSLSSHCRLIAILYRKMKRHDCPRWLCSYTPPPLCSISFFKLEKVGDPFPTYQLGPSSLLSLFVGNQSLYAALDRSQVGIKVLSFYIDINPPTGEPY